MMYNLALYTLSHTNRGVMYIVKYLIPKSPPPTFPPKLILLSPAKLSTQSGSYYTVDTGHHSFQLGYGFKEGVEY